jgi:hypothetical protein
MSPKGNSIDKDATPHSNTDVSNTNGGANNTGGYKAHFKTKKKKKS